MKNSLDYIELSESSILGWDKLEDALVFYVELLLAKGHENFEEFDQDTDFGCFKIGQLRFNGFKSLSGLKADRNTPIWNDQLGEYEDVLEIDTIKLTKNRAEIHADGNIIEFNYDKFQIEIMDSFNLV